jgi:transcriptional regulator with XRE-family HTH domain
MPGRKPKKLTGADCMYMERFLSTLDEMLRRRAMNLTDLADKSGIYAGRFSKWRSLEGMPTMTHLIKISDALGVSLDQLVLGKLPADMPSEEDQFVLDLIFHGPTRLGAKEALRRLVAGATRIEEAERGPLDAPPAKAKGGTRRPKRKSPRDDPGGGDGPLN